jgi:hypothetical protein
MINLNIDFILKILHIDQEYRKYENFNNCSLIFKIHK